MNDCQDHHTYILSWDCFGLESCINATQEDINRTWNLLRDSNEVSTDVAQVLQQLIFRARFNTQRHYEIYAIDVDNTITEDDIVSQFESNPQGMADLVRSRGRKIYSDRANKDSIKIV